MTAPDSMDRSEGLGQPAINEGGCMNMLSSKIVMKSLGMRFLIVVIALVLVGLGSKPAALAQTTSTWSGGSGNWSPCPNQGGTALWDTCSTNVVPNGNFIAVI